MWIPLAALWELQNNRKERAMLHVDENTRATARVVVGTHFMRGGGGITVHTIELPYKAIYELNGYLADVVFMDTSELIDGLEALIETVRLIQRNCRVFPAPDATDGPRYRVK